ncbi:hypothetical protein A8990_13255 [Paenibacillus taihuensis]|uniref:Lipoprotein n=1 Tax=Paenibacillus taihuensis TaxID=1156355 RepID=A0A3D9R2Q2_9BACL|nr:hypothetical protein [Paenibacillus taihuensis]REE69658.1 hypothetical protein A8990_13255 [Paenibacillus taihuensis]
MTLKHFSSITVMLTLCGALVGCKTDYKDASHVAAEYVKHQYVVTDYHQIKLPEGTMVKLIELKPYIMDDFTRIQETVQTNMELPLQIALAEKSNISTENLHILPNSKKAIQDKSNKLLEYDTTLVLTNDEGDSKEVKVNGVLTMIKVNEEWKVLADWNRSQSELASLAKLRS